jgi:PleD family two-component response regulator
MHYRPRPLRGSALLAGKKVLLIDRSQPTRDVRATVLRSHGIEVHTADSLQAARFLWQRDVYDLILIDVRKHLPGEALEFYEQIRGASSRERFAFLVGPPVYLSRTWPDEVSVHDASQGQWGATVRRFMEAA